MVHRCQSNRRSRRQQSRFSVSDAGKGHASTAPCNDIAATTNLEVYEQVQGTVALIRMIRLQDGMTRLNSQSRTGGRFSAPPDKGAAEAGENGLIQSNAIRARCPGEDGKALRLPQIVSNNPARHDAAGALLLHGEINCNCTSILPAVPIGVIGMKQS